MSDARDLPDVLLPDEAADLLRVSVKTLTRLHIPYAKVGRFRRYLRDDVLAYIREKAA